MTQSSYQDKPLLPHHLLQADQLQFATEASGVGFWEIELATNTLLWDSNSKRLFGIAPDQELPFEEVLALIHPDDLTAVTAAIQQATAGHLGGRYDMRHRTIGANDGLLRWVHFSGQVYFNEQQQPVRFGGISQDITIIQQEIERTAAGLKEAVQQSEVHFRNIVEQAPVAIGLLAGPDMVLETGNKKIYEIWGKDESAIGKRLIDFLPEIKGQGFLELLEEVYRSGEAYFGTGALARLERNGILEDAYFNFVYTPMYKNGVVTGIMVLANEVTQMVLAQKATEASEQKLRSLLAVAPAAIALFTGKDLVVEMPNQAFLDIAGKGREILGKPLREAMPELVEQPFMKILEEVYTTGKMYESFGTPGDIIQDGVVTKHYFDFSYSPLFDAEGNVYAILDITVDVTKQMEAQQKVNEAQALTSGAVELAELGTWSIDVATQQLTYSDRMYEWYGIDPLKGSINDVYHQIDEADRTRIETAINSAMQPGSAGIFNEEFTISNRETGKKRVLHSQGKTFFNEQGIAIKMAGTAQDITVQRQLQWALEQEIQVRTEELDASNEELQSANEELATTNEELAATNEELAQLNDALSTSNNDLQQFAHIISHDLKEPIRKIKTFLSMLEGDAENVFSPKSRTYVEKMNKSARRVSDMIEGVLKYSTVNAGEKAVEVVALTEVFNNIVTDLEIMIGQKNALVEFRDLPVIEGIPILIYQLFYNLLINSLKFTAADRQPKVVITARPLTVKNISFAEITIQDNGIGFDPKNAVSIFNTFVRLHSKDQFEGTGLGLALCKKIVQRHHGTIEAVGQPGEGASFIILLPVHQPFNNL